MLIFRKTSQTLAKTEQRYWKKFFEGFSKYLYQQKGYYDNLVANCFKTIKTVFNFLRIERSLTVGEFYKQFRIPSQQPVPIVLMPEQLQFLITDLDFDKKLPSHLRRTKDTFVFGCTTGLRINDLMKLRPKHLVKKGTTTYLNIYTQKTSTPVLIPLPSYCEAIIRKYKVRSKGYLLPRLSNTNLNLQIKEMGRLANWNYPVPKYRSRSGKLVEIKNETGACWKFYEHLTCHTMRRTAITTLLMLGVHEEVVRRISGHAPGSKEFYRYVSLAQSYVDQQVQTAYQKLSMG